MTEVICDYDFCKYYENGRCGLDTVEICGGHCQDLDDEQGGMKMLDINTAIKHCLEVAEQNDTQAEKWQEEGGEQWGKTTACRECAADYRRLAEWLMEYKYLKAEQNDQYVFIHELMSKLKEAKRLLKDFVSEYDGCKTFPNRNEVLKLIGEDEDVNT